MSARIEQAAADRDFSPVAGGPLEVFARVDAPGRHWAACIVRRRVLFIPLRHNGYFAISLELEAIRALARRGIDPVQAASEPAGHSLQGLFQRYLKAAHPSLRFRRLMHSLLLPGWGPYPLAHLRSVDYASAACLHRRWERKFDERFLQFRAWAAQRVPLQSADDFTAELNALSPRPHRTPPPP
jgi:hypothetical protein